MSTPIGGPTRGFWITPGEVQKAGDSARKVAKDIPDEIKTLYKPTDAAVAGLAGFETAKAIDDCLEAWAKALRSLAGMVEGAADAVGSSSTSFTREDHERGKSFLGFGPYTPYAPGVTAPGAHGPYAPYTPYAPGVTLPPVSNGGR
ncbi:type VII secretion target [Streptomyces sp. BPTC-684]|uniref:type VII secretion target n=1 Tax=Streptomyces sp. BPTC-684 TaxID=3043734 RepID=UPI0024B2806D|nr:type VII secretion target [Streptomyces sp. BPTC-684]WHM40082.1 type VII secretion target [Streptomyces sp. BPTC-684]